MKHVVDRILMAYRPLYMRGLLMDGQYKSPRAMEKPPVKGRKVIHVTPAFEPKRVRTLHVSPVAAIAVWSMRIMRFVLGPSSKSIAKLHR